jgi:hypothetical protein
MIKALKRSFIGICCEGRARLRRMSERELLRFGRAARYMCWPAANHGKEPLQVFVIQLREAVKEWGRRRCVTNGF